MAVICFASLKGGVGKTTLSINIGAAFAERGCDTVIVDLDPTAHASRCLNCTKINQDSQPESPLARLFLSGKMSIDSLDFGGVTDRAISESVPLVVPVRPGLSLIPSGPELRHFLWGRGARAFSQFFPRLIEELNCSYDCVIIDTPPDFNVLTRNSIAVSELVIVPVDASAMSIHSLEDIVRSSAHIKGPTWCILRTMVNRQAARIQALSTKRLHENLHLSSSTPLVEEEIHADSDKFIAMLQKVDSASPRLCSDTQGACDDSPIYLLNNVVYRSEQQNRLTFFGRTAFESRASLSLAQQYLAVAREMEEISAVGDREEFQEIEADSFPLNYCRGEHSSASGGEAV